MASKFQKIPFDKQNLLKMNSISAKNESGEFFIIEYNSTKLRIINNQLCFVTPTGHLMPICRISTIQSMIDKNDN